MLKSYKTALATLKNSLKLASNAVAPEDAAKLVRFASGVMLSVFVGVKSLWFVFCFVYLV
jgi:hypothetical protein